MVSKAAMRVETWKVDKVKPYQANPRSKQPIDKVAESLRTFGWRQPIVVDSDGVIVVGHTRYQAALQLGMTTVPVHVAKDLTPEQCRSYRIADNRTGELAEWDDALLVAELTELSEIGALPMTGFSADDLIDLGRTHERQQAKGTGIDVLNVTMAPPKTLVSVGDVWDLGKHVLVAEKVVSGWPNWVRLLEPGMLLCPYPTPHVTLTERAQKTPCLLVQPDAFVAGHCVDRYQERFGRAKKRDA